MSYEIPSRTVDPESPDDLLNSGAFPVITKEVDIAAGVLVAKGSVMGRVTAGGWLLSASAAGDGSQTPAGILLQEVAASGAARKGLVALTGEFAAHLLVYGVGHTRATVEWPLRAVSIFLNDVQEN